MSWTILARVNPTSLKLEILFCASVALVAVAPAQAPERSVTERPLAEIRQLAGQIDAAVDKALAEAQVPPTERSDDATFLRRAYLTVIGRIPTAAEATAFLTDSRSNRRELLLDRLLDSAGYVSHEFHFWADLLRARSRLMRQVSGEPFLHWLQQCLVEGRPYDEMVKEMLTAEGPAHARGQGATGYLLRDLEMPLDSMANSVRVFLGTRLECAQCHNHPFDKWKQVDFYKMAAFAGGMRYRTDYEQSAAAQQLRNAGLKLVQEHGRQAQAALRRLVQPITIGIDGSGTGLIRLPDNYKYADAKPNDPVVGQTIFGTTVDLPVEVPQAPRRARPEPRRPQASSRIPLGKEIDSRDAFANWLADADNPRFAPVIANRLWQRVFGKALVEPLDDWRDDTKAAIPDALEAFSRIVVQLGFDLRQAERVLLHTRLFQRRTPPTAPPDEGTYLFPGPVLHRMRPEEFWDSLVTLVHDDIDARLRPVGERAREVYARYEKLANLTPAQLEEEVTAELLRTTDPAKYRDMEREKRAEAQRERRLEIEQKAQEARPLLRDLALARRRGDQQAVADLEARIRSLGVPLPGQRAAFADRDLTRASDLPQPAPAGHLLRQLGQSDREQVDNAHAEANVPQVLSLLNGFVDQRLLGGGGSALARRVQAEKEVSGRIRAAFLTVLTRVPDSREMEAWQKAMAEGGDDALEDLVWVLVNSNEFRFVR